MTNSSKNVAPSIFCLCLAGVGEKGRGGGRRDKMFIMLLKACQYEYLTDTNQKAARKQSGPRCGNRSKFRLAAGTTW